MAYEWKDKVLLVTGGATGIGSHVVRIALEEGAKEINIVDINEANGTSLLEELNAKHGDGKVKFIKCDVTNHEQLVATFDSVLSKKDNEYVVLNNAAILNDSLETYRKQIDINVTALITGSLQALELLRKDKGGNGGTIINISSIAALCLIPHTPIYSATKSAVLHFSVCLGSDEYYLRTGVRVLTVCFGATDTGLIALQNMGSFDEVAESKFSEALAVYPGQKVESAARGVIDAYKQGSSGSVWMAIGGRPVEDITPAHTEAFNIMSAPMMK